MSEDRKVKVWNRTKGLHHFVFSDGKRVFPIAPGGFTKVPLDEIYYVNSTSKSFSKGLLEIDSEEKELLEELGYAKRSPNVFTPQEIKDLLSRNLDKKTKEILSQITERHAKDKLIEVARTMDLTHTKIKFIEEITGMTVFNELTDNDKKEDKK
jgi:hypothetical protein